MPGVQAFFLFQNRQAILQHILDVKRPEGNGDEHPIVEATDSFDAGGVQRGGDGMVLADDRLGPISPAIGQGLDFFQIKIE